MNDEKQFPKTLLGIILVLILLSSLVIAYLSFSQNQKNTSSTEPTPTLEETPTPTPTQFVASNEVPKFSEKIIVGNLSNPWDMIMFEDNSFIFTERNNRIKFYVNGKITQLNSPSDVYVRGEGGMLSLALDPDFKNNGYIYTCFNSNLLNVVEVRVARFKFDRNSKQLTERKDIVTGLPSITSGRHSGCQLEFGPDGYLWIGTGDAATSQNPQSTSSLGGKVLRVDRDGKAAPENQGGSFDPRIFNYGHRNVQGLGFFDPNAGFSVPGISIEQGSGVDDEVNKLVKGNFGWDPKPPYNESGVPMTDLTKFPNAVKAIWSSGQPTVATSGGTIIQGEQWKSWNQAVAVAVQKDTKVIILELNKDLSVKKETIILDDKYGRIRTVVMGSDGNLYILTDNGSSSDKIVQLAPQP